MSQANASPETSISVKATIFRTIIGNQHVESVKTIKKNLDSDKRDESFIRKVFSAKKKRSFKPNGELAVEKIRS
jgi:hypothetical protein